MGEVLEDMLNAIDNRIEAIDKEWRDGMICAEKRFAVIDELENLRKIFQDILSKK